MLTGQFANKPTRRQSSRGLIKSRTSQLADSKFLTNMKLLHYLYTKSNPIHNHNTIEYVYK